MPTYPVTVPPGGAPGEIYKGWIQNLGINPAAIGAAGLDLSPGSTLSVLANASSMAAAVGGSNLGPANCIAQSMDRTNVASATIATTSGILQMAAVWLPQAMQVSTINVLAGSTAGVTMSHWWFGLYDNARNLLAVTADQLAGAIGANATLSVPIATVASGSATSFLTTYTGIHYIGVLINASTQPTLAGVTTTVPASTIPPILFGSSNTGLTTPQTFPTQATAITPLGVIPYVWLT